MNEISQLTHSVRSISVLKSALKKREISIETLLLGTDIDLSLLDDPGNRIDLFNELEFYRRLSQVSSDPLLGLAIGREYHLARYGIWGFALMSAPSANKAMEVALNYILLAYSYFDYRIVRENSQIWLESTSIADFDGCKQMMADREMSAVVLIFEEITGRNDIVKKLGFPSDFEGDVELYKEFYQRPVTLDGDCYKIYFDQSLLELPLPKSDPETFEICCERCEKLQTTLLNQGKTSETIRKIILHNPREVPDIEEVARILNISSRTLRRRLKIEGSGFKELLQETRYELAKSYLVDTDIKIEEISDLLGYNDSGNFTNAFKRWSGCSPSNYRREMFTI